MFREIKRKYLNALVRNYRNFERGRNRVRLLELSFIAWSSFLPGLPLLLLRLLLLVAVQLLVGKLSLRRALIITIKIDIIVIIVADIIVVLITAVVVRSACGIDLLR